MISNRIVALSELDYAQKIQCCSYQHFHGRRWQKTNKNLMRLHQIDENIVVPLHFAQYKKQRLNSNIDNRLHSKFLTVSAATHSTTTLYCDYVLSYSSAAALPFVLRSLLQLLFDFISVWVCMRNNFFFYFVLFVIVNAAGGVVDIGVTVQNGTWLQRIVKYILFVYIVQQWQHHFAHRPSR